MCHPVSESVSSHPTPVVHQNRTRIGVRKASSARDSISEIHAPRLRWICSQRSTGGYRRNGTDLVSDDVRGHLSHENYKEAENTSAHLSTCNHGHRAHHRH